MIDAMRRIGPLIRGLEDQFAGQFAGQPTAASELLVGLGVQFGEPERDEEA